MDKRLSITRNGIKEPYSERQLRIDNPDISFAAGLRGVDLSAYGVTVEPATATEKSAARVDKDAFEVDSVPMQCFLYAMREYGLRVQFEFYVQCRGGYARDYWMTAPRVRKDNTQVILLAEYFQLSAAEVDHIFSVAGGIEE